MHRHAAKSMMVIPFVHRLSVMHRVALTWMKCREDGFIISPIWRINNAHHGKKLNRKKKFPVKYNALQINFHRYNVIGYILIDDFIKFEA